MDKLAKIETGVKKEKETIAKIRQALSSLDAKTFKKVLAKELKELQE